MRRLSIHLTRERSPAGERGRGEGGEEVDDRQAIDHGRLAMTAEEDVATQAPAAHERTGVRGANGPAIAPTLLRSSRVC